ncbi:AI-2E family transporter [Jatrophihabitans telluris]|uniref:AI-2E family transporter n=1 Tax=Jatrophihabitans telluris TaxID=2038343 RepID=A0ABY4R2Y3_9ACTN|nr:AI-2E family transporter [Jatrophihabitans telluris]UQX89882.1 AI-2E family transporter [Jatrophihabitans telluris]
MPGRTDPLATYRPTRGRQFATYSPFRLGLTAAIGFGFAYLLFRALEQGQHTLILIALSLFLAAGLDPAVRKVESWGLPRGLSVAAVFLTAVLFLTGLGLAVVPPLVSQTTTFVDQLPHYVTQLQHNQRIAELDRRFGLLTSIQKYLQDSKLIQQLATNLFSVGSTVATTIFEVFSLGVLTLYFLLYLRDITGFAYRLSPASRRARVRGIGDKIVLQIGRYVIGTAGLALCSGLVSLVFFWTIRVPYPFALAFIVAVLEIAPLVGQVLATAVVATVVFLESTASGIATVVFLLAWYTAQRIWLYPRLLHRDVRISPAAAVVGALAGYTLFGVIGFLVSIPLVAVITLILREVVLPRQAAR